MTQNLYLLFISIGVIAILLYILKNNIKYTNINKIILGLLIFVLLFELAGYYTANRKINNLLLYNICWVYLESMLIIGYFYMLHEKAVIKNLILISVGLVLFLSLLNAIWLEPFVGTFQFNSFALFSILILGLCIHFLIQILRFRIFQDHNILAIPHFWIVVGILFFYFEALITFGLIFHVAGLEHRLVSGLLFFIRIVAVGKYLFLGFSFYSQYVFKDTSKGLSVGY